MHPDHDWFPIPFQYGPRFGKAMQVDAELRELLRHGLYQDALDLLVRRPDWPATRAVRALLRCYLLLGQDRVLESWKEAQALEDPEHELFYSIGLKAQKRAYDEQNDEDRAAEILDAGLQALTRALEVKAGAYWTLLAKSSLLRQKANLTGDKALLDEAERLNEQGRAMVPKPPS
ncbi:MAG TPA: hypothetical protein VFR31_05140 [Thermoanaerobaculia bacterium]|nr:hypothetical protein [Thermoanaerobaculia bacterium]